MPAVDLIFSSGNYLSWINGWIAPILGLSAFYYYFPPSLTLIPAVHTCKKVAAAPIASASSQQWARCELCAPYHRDLVMSTSSLTVRERSWNSYLYRVRRSAFTAACTGSAQNYRQSSPVHNFYGLQSTSDWNIAIFTGVTRTVFLMLLQIGFCCVFFPHFGVSKGAEHPEEAWDGRQSVLTFKGQQLFSVLRKKN